jgi:hypothetical protein
VSSPRHEPVDESARQIEQATADLDNLRQLLVRAGEGQIDPAELREALEAYWQTNRPVLVALAAALGEQLRVQTLQALCQWRAELARSLSSRRDSPR